MKALVPFPTGFGEYEQPIGTLARRACLSRPEIPAGSNRAHRRGVVRARVKIGLANLAYNFRRQAWLDGQAAPT